MRIVQKEVLKKFREIAKKHNIPLQTVIDIESSIWKYVSKEMSEGVTPDFDTFRNIYIRNLGTFYANRGKYNNVNRNRKDD